MEAPEPNRTELEKEDLNRLRERTRHYATSVQAEPSLIDAMEDLLSSPLGMRLAKLSSDELHRALVNDAYKPKMHKMYAELYQGVSVDFCLNIRKTPFPLPRIKEEDPELYAEFEAFVASISSVQPITGRTEQILQQYFNFTTSQEMRERARRNGVAPVRWQTLADGQHAAFASGPAEAASNLETSMTQLVQEFTIRAQARDLTRRTGHELDRVERLANSLGHLVSVVTKLRRLPSSIKTALFSGRRASDRSYLLLQNAFCARHVPGYVGTSAIFAVDRIDAALVADGVDSLEERRKIIGSLVGTHAHEVMSITAQLMSAYDDAVQPGKGPVPLSGVLAHLLFLRTNGGLASSVALADTFGTEAFIAAALAAKVPQEFVDDMRERYPQDCEIQPGAVVFDLIRVWRLDSGDYASMAEAVVQGWERRCAELGAAALPKPGLMDSNLSDAEELLEIAALPERTRPTFCAFGGLADGFLPFQLSNSEVAELKLASVVMKAIQARHPQVEMSMHCAGKLGDDASHAKAQVDPRLPSAEQEAVKARMSAMFQTRDIAEEAATTALARMYHDVTRKHILC